MAATHHIRHYAPIVAPVLTVLAVALGVAGTAHADYYGTSQRYITVTPPKPAPGSKAELSACVSLDRIGDNSIVKQVVIEIDGKRAPGTFDFGWCDNGGGFVSKPRAVGYGPDAFTWDHWACFDSPGTGGGCPVATVQTALIPVPGPGEHTVTIVVDYADGHVNRTGAKFAAATIDAQALHPGAATPSWGATQRMASAAPAAPNWGATPGNLAAPTHVSTIAPTIFLSPTRGASGSKVQVSACGVPAHAGTQYDVLVDNAKQLLNVPLATCGSGKFGFGTGTNLPPVTLTITGARQTRHTIEVTNIGTAIYLVE